MKIGAGTLDEMFYALIEQLNQEEPVLRERHRRMLYNAFMRMAGEPEIPLIDGEPEPLPPLPPGKSRIVSFD